MKSKVFLTVVSIAAALMQVPVQAQKNLEKNALFLEEEKKDINLPPDQVIHHFRAYNSGTVEVKWKKVETENNIYNIGTYNLDGDQKKVIYRDYSHFCTETQIPLQYCPKKMRATLDTMASVKGFTLKELYYQSAGRNNAYRAVMQKGKGKKAVVRDLLFDSKSAFLREEKPENMDIFRL